MSTRTTTTTQQRDDTERTLQRADRTRPDAPSESKRPFDSAELRRVPRPREDDPPYRSWWVVGPNSYDDAR